VVPVIVILFTAGDMVLLGELYAFGLLGCFVLSSAGLDVMRWRAGVRGIRFWVGILVTAMVLLAWVTNLHIKVSATIFGSLICLVGLLMAVGTRRKWFADWFYKIGYVAEVTPRRISETEERIEHEEKLES